MIALGRTHLQFYHVSKIHCVSYPSQALLSRVLSVVPSEGSIWGATCNWFTVLHAFSAVPWSAILAKEGPQIHWSLELAPGSKLLVQLNLTFHDSGLAVATGASHLVAPSSPCCERGGRARLRLQVALHSKSRWAICQSCLDWCEPRHSRCIVHSTHRLGPGRWSESQGPVWSAHQWSPGSFPCAFCVWSKVWPVLQSLVKASLSSWKGLLVCNFCLHCLQATPVRKGTHWCPSEEGRPKAAGQVLSSAGWAVSCWCWCLLLCGSNDSCPWGPMRSAAARRMASASSSILAWRSRISVGLSAAAACWASWEVAFWIKLRSGFSFSSLREKSRGLTISKSSHSSPWNKSG